jgi:hypothetical protein
MDGMTLSDWILRRVWGCLLDSSGSEYGSLAGGCEHGNELSGSMKDREFTDQLSDYRLIKKDSVSSG